METWRVREVWRSIREEWIRSGGKCYAKKDAYSCTHCSKHGWMPCRALSNWAVKILKGVDSPNTLSPHPRAAPLSLGRFYSLYLIRIFLNSAHVHCLVTFCCPPLRRIWINGFCNLLSSSRRVWLDFPSAFSCHGLNTQFSSAFPSVPHASCSPLTTPSTACSYTSLRKKNSVKLILR